MFVVVTYLIIIQLKQIIVYSLLSNIYNLHYYYKNLNYLNNTNNIYIQKKILNL